jgi:uncharacterized protein
VIFVDTGAFLARHLSRDQHHAAAVEAWARLAGDRERCVTSSFVLDETVTLLSRRAGPAFAAERALALLGSTALSILRPEPRDEEEALRWLEKLGGQDVSFTDCVSFALMKRHRLPRVFGFDRHFAAAGFTLWPSL